MSRKLTSDSSVEQLKREAKRWLKALRAGDSSARERLDRSHPKPPAIPTLRAVQHALACEYGFDGWTALKRATEALAAAGPRQRAIQELLEACGKGDVARARQLLDEYPDIINERATLPGNTGRRTALHFGVGHADMVRLLLARGANPNIRDDGDDAMPLHFAAEAGNMEVVRLLIEHGADAVGAGTMHELNVLGWAVCWDYVHNQEVAQYLLAHGAQHTIHTAVALGDVAQIRAIAARAPAAVDEPMDRTNVRRRPLHLAVVKRRADSLAALLELGVDTEAEDASGLTALDEAAMSDASELVELLLRRGAQVRLPAALMLNRAADVERLLRAQPDALKPGHRWDTLIVRAAAVASGAIIERLIRAGAAVNAAAHPDTAVDHTQGYSPLHAAAFHGNADAVRVLLAHGANPNSYESKWCATAAGWADYAGHEEVRDLILQARIDLFQAVYFDLVDRIPVIARQSPWLLHQRFGDAVGRELRPDQNEQPWHTPLVWAVLGNRPGAVRALLEQGATQIVAPDGRSLLHIAQDTGHTDIVALLRQHQRVDQTHESRVHWFVKHACPDHDIRGGWHHRMARHTAQRLLRDYPDIARDSFCTAVICGDSDAVERALAERPALAGERGGPKDWTPLLYLCFTRLPSVQAAAHDNARSAAPGNFAGRGDAAVAIARALLDHGADPNAYFMAGDSRYTPLVGVIGEGEEDRPAHAQRDALVRLLLERGAEPYDAQVLYNIHFHGRVLWYLELIYDHTVSRDRSADWQDPAWHMLDMGGYGTGARYHLEIALRHDDLTLAKWCLDHGASPNSPPPTDPRWEQRSLHEDAVRSGRTDFAELLVQYGAVPAHVERSIEDEFTAACFRLDRARARELINARPELLHAAKPICAAAKQDRADVVAFLLDLGTPIEIEDEHRTRPLHTAAYARALAVTQLLIDRGAAIDPVETRYGNTPLGFAVHDYYEPMIELLGRHSRDMWNLIFTGRVDRVRAVLRETPEVARTVTDDNETFLMWLPDDEAAAVEIVELLLAHGADAAVRTGEGLTAADYASRRGLTRAASLLGGNRDG
ncbi:MAG TPA: ankyrin repeat domain-containing protein [Longimicrobiales bacterium]|nr:ankyrin repeat domain-containing protein [Longimicrobiales bacterium]